MNEEKMNKLIAELEAADFPFWFFVAHPLLRYNSKFLLASKSFYAYENAARRLKNKKDFNLEFVKRNPWVYKIMPKKFRNDEEITLSVVSIYGHLLEHSSLNMKCNDKVINAAVKSDGWAIKHVPFNKLTDDLIFLALDNCLGDVTYLAEYLVKNTHISLSKAVSDRLNAILNDKGSENTAKTEKIAEITEEVIKPKEIKTESIQEETEEMGL